MHRRGAGGPPAPAGIAVTAPTVTAPAAEVEGHKRTQTPQPAQLDTKKTRPLHQLKSTGTQHPPTQLLKQSFPPCLQLPQGKRILTFSKTPGKIQQKQTEARRKPPLLQKEKPSPSLQKPQEAVRQPSTPSCASRLASCPGTTARKRAGAR